MLKGKWALVTGAGGGLGLAIAECLAAAGANIALHDMAEPRGACDSIRSRFGVEAVSIAADLRQRSEIEAMLADLISRFGAIDIVVNNAVVRHFAPISQFPPDRWEEALAVNLSAPFHIIRLALPGMMQRNWGRILNLTSIYSTRATPNRIDYVTTKTAIVGMTRAVALETARTGITCNALSPGTVPTPSILAKIEAIAALENASVADTTSTYLGTRQPSGEFIPAQSVGEMAVFLCSPAGRSITGTVLPIDGGWSAI
jgi:3-hydroxybutyrate dehydrogenase